MYYKNINQLYYYESHMFIMMKPFSDQDEVTLVSWKGTMIPPNNPKGAMQGWRGRGQDSGASHFW